MLRGRGCGHAGARATAGTPGTAGTTGKKGRAGADFSSLESLRSLPSLFALGPWSRLSVSKPWPPLRLRASRKGPSETQRRRYRSGADACRREADGTRQIPRDADFGGSHPPREADQPRRKADTANSGRTAQAGFRAAQTPAVPIGFARRISAAVGSELGLSGRLGRDRPPPPQAMSERVHDPECPYDPNDPAAVESFWKKATIRRPGQL